MRLRAFALAALFVATAQAQVVWVRTTMAGKPTCEAGIKGRVFEISDATTESDCSTGGATGNSRKMSLCWCVWTAGTSAYEWQAIARGAGAGGTPGGSDTQVQYNDGSAFGGDAGLTYNETTNVLTATGGFVGAVAGNASTATALAANGANCSAGSYARGVDASGAAENCTVAGVGDVVGPASTTDDSIAVFSGTTGKLIEETPASGFAYLSGLSLRAAGAQFKNGSVFLTHQGFGDYDSPLIALGPNAPDYRTGSGTTLGGTLGIYKGAILFTSAANAVNSHNVAIYNEIDGEVSIASPDAAADPRAFHTGGLRVGVVTKTANYTATAYDHVILVDASGGAVTITLPAIATATRGVTYRVKKVDSSVNVVTIGRTGSDTIDGATTSLLATQYLTRDFVAPDAGVDWAAF